VSTFPVKGRQNRDFRLCKKSQACHKGRKRGGKQSENVEISMDYGGGKRGWRSRQHLGDYDQGFGGELTDGMCKSPLLNKLEYSGKALLAKIQSVKLAVPVLHIFRIHMKNNFMVYS
jgi:hypothetical protein